jgi:hypothetical protein
MLPFVRVAAVGGMFLFAAGCQQRLIVASRPKTVRTVATVTYNGQPVQGAVVTLRATTATGRGAAGITDSRGQTAMMTFEPGDGAIAGSYKVTVSKMEAAASGPQIQPPDKGGGAAYARMMASTERPGKGAPTTGPKNALPVKYNDAEKSGLTAEVKPGTVNNLSFPLTD